jgi:hypothetical protein
MKKFFIMNANRTENIASHDFWKKSGCGYGSEVEQSYVYTKKQLKTEGYFECSTAFEKVQITFKLLQSYFQILDSINEEKFVKDHETPAIIHTFDISLHFSNDDKDAISLEVRVRHPQFFGMRLVRLSESLKGFDQLYKWLENNGGLVEWSEVNDTQFSK